KKRFTLTIYNISLPYWIRIVVWCIVIYFLKLYNFPSSLPSLLQTLKFQFPDFVL
ncbi:hypothetical protein KSS87_018841, partial [Heliosperma pusillum]